MFKKMISFVVISAFIIPIPQSQAVRSINLPLPGQMVHLTAPYEPVMIKGLTVHPENPFLFDFIVDPGEDQLQGDALRKEGEKLIRYFLASMALPSKDVWVNLSPYEKNRIIPQALGQTEMGRDLLAQDYILKQMTASLIYPEQNLGKKFWDRVYAKARIMYGTNFLSQMSVNVGTFNKVWITADRAEVFEHDQSAFVVGSHLKVMLEEDYLASSRVIARSETTKQSKNRLPRQANSESRNDTHGASSRHPSGVGIPTSINKIQKMSGQLIKELILPELEKEINTGKNFANLRQIFNSIILASWYKNNLKAALLNQVYANQGKVKGIDQNDQQTNQGIYEQYLKAYKKGVFNYIKEDVNPENGQIISRKYFSGGVDEGMAAMPLRNMDQASLVSALPDRALMSFSVFASHAKDFAMVNRIMPATHHREHIHKVLDLVSKMGVNGQFVYSKEVINIARKYLIGYDDDGYNHDGHPKSLNSLGALHLLDDLTAIFRNRGFAQQFLDSVWVMAHIYDQDYLSDDGRIEVLKYLILNIAKLEAVADQSSKIPHFHLIKNLTAILWERWQVWELLEKGKNTDEQVKALQYLNNVLNQVLNSELPHGTQYVEAPLQNPSGISRQNLRNFLHTYLEDNFRTSLKLADKQHIIDFILDAHSGGKYFLGNPEKLHIMIGVWFLVYQMREGQDRGFEDLSTWDLEQKRALFLTNYLNSNYDEKYRVHSAIGAGWLGKDRRDSRPAEVQEMLRVFDWANDFANGYFYDPDHLWRASGHKKETLDADVSKFFHHPDALEDYVNGETINLEQYEETYNAVWLKVKYALTQTQFSKLLYAPIIRNPLQLNLREFPYKYEMAVDLQLLLARESIFRRIADLKITLSRKHKESEIQRIKNEISALRRSIYLLGLQLSVFDLAMKIEPTPSLQDAAMTKNGGIDLDTSKAMHWNIYKDAQGVEIKADSAMIEKIKREGIDRLSPVIFRVMPISSIWPVLGLKEPTLQMAQELHPSQEHS